MTTPVAPSPTETDGPVVQSITIGFRVLLVAIVVLFGAWVGSNWQSVPAESRAVVLRFGRIVGVQPAGLVMAWPRPTGEMVLVPGAERLLTVRTATTARLDGLQDSYTDANGAHVPDGAGSYLTGDGGVVLLAATIAYRVGDAAAYYVAQSHVEAALRRLFEASAVSLAARRDLDDFLVARPDRATADPALENRRQAMRADLVREMNRRLAALAANGGDLGVSVSRIDLDATLPPSAKIAFDGVLVAIQMAEQGIADSRTKATRMLQEGERERDRLLAAAHASAEERVGAARARTAGIAAIEAAMTPALRPAMLDQIYRDQLAKVLHAVGTLTAVDGIGGARLILPAVPGAAP